MRIGKWIAAIAVTMVLSSSSIALAQGKGHGKGHDKKGDDDQGAEFYKDRDRQELRGWYDGHRDQLPPGLAKKDRLPPGLEKQLVRRGTLPPGLQKRLQPCPKESDGRFPPPPPSWPHVGFVGPFVLLNPGSNIFVHIFLFETA